MDSLLEHDYGSPRSEMLIGDAQAKRGEEGRGKREEERGQRAEGRGKTATVTTRTRMTVKNQNDELMMDKSGSLGKRFEEKHPISYAPNPH